MLVFAVLTYLFLNLCIGFFAQKYIRNPEDFALASRRLPFGVATVALFATWFGSETILGASTQFVEHGVLGIIEEPLGAGLCLILVGLFFAKKLYHLQVITLNDYLGQVYGKKVEYFSALLMVVSFLGWIAAQLLALSFVLETLLQIPRYWAMPLGTLVVVAYTYLGGMWAISITDFLQSLLIVLGLLWLTLEIIPIFDMAKLATLPPDFFRFYPQNNFLEINEYISAWATVGLGSIASQDVFQRIMSAKSAKIASRSAVVAGILYLSMAFLPLFLALAAKLLLGSEWDTQKNILLELVSQRASVPLQMLFFASLLAAVMSTASSTILAPATVLAENLLKDFLGNTWKNPKSMLWLMRISVVLMSILGLILAFFYQNIFHLASAASAFSLVSLLVPLLGALYLKNHNAYAAFGAMIGGLLVWIFLPFLSDFPNALAGLLASIFAFGIFSRLRI